MKIKLGTIEKEDFLSSFVIALEDGTILKNRTDWCWSGRDIKRKEMVSFVAFVEEIQRLGIEVEGLEELKTKFNKDLFLD